jgi:predicted benzoate:H+ symporter BenE
MYFKDERRTYRAMLIVGILFLIAGLLSQRMLAHGLHVNQDLADGITGLLFGVTVGCFIVAVRQMMRDPT